MMELPTASNANLEVTKTKKDKLIVNSALLDNIKTKKDKMLAANVLLDNIKTKKDKPGAAHAMDLLIWLANVSVSGCESCGCSSQDRKSNCACKILMIFSITVIRMVDARMFRDCESDFRQYKSSNRL